MKKQKCINSTSRFARVITDGGMSVGYIDASEKIKTKAAINAFVKYHGHKVSYKDTMGNAFYVSLVTTKNTHISTRVSAKPAESQIPVPNRKNKSAYAALLTQPEMTIGFDGSDCERKRISTSARSYAHTKGIKISAKRVGYSNTIFLKVISRDMPKRSFDHLPKHKDMKSGDKLKFVSKSPRKETFFTTNTNKLKNKNDGFYVSTNDFPLTTIRGSISRINSKKNGKSFGVSRLDKTSFIVYLK